MQRRTKIYLTVGVRAFVVTCILGSLAAVSVV